MSLTPTLQRQIPFAFLPSHCLINGLEREDLDVDRLDDADRAAEPIDYMLTSPIFDVGPPSTRLAVAVFLPAATSLASSSAIAGPSPKAKTS